MRSSKKRARHPEMSFVTLRPVFAGRFCFTIGVWILSFKLP